jgi:hypothetical protein
MTELPPIAIGTTVFALKTRLARPGLDEGAIDGEVLIGHQVAGALDDATEEAAGRLLIHQPIQSFERDSPRSQPIDQQCSPLVLIQDLGQNKHPKRI